MSTGNGLAVRKGTSQSLDTTMAAQELFDALFQPDIKLAVFYCSPEYDLPALAVALRARFGETPLIGCTTAGEITPVGYLSGTLTGFSLSDPSMQVATLEFAVEQFDSVESALRISGLLDRLAMPGGEAATSANTFGFMLIDGMSMQEELVVNCLYQNLRGIDLVGGSAADGLRFGSTWLYHDGAFHQRTALITLVRSALPFLAFRTQHFVKSETRMVVTKSDPARRTVFEINGRAAAPEFARLIGLESTDLDALVFATHPVMVRVGGQSFVRSIGKVNDDGSLQFFCAIDDGIVLSVAQGVDLIDNLTDAFDKVRAHLGTPQLVIGCDCVLRRLEIERKGLVERVGEIFRENNVVGFATYGEQFNAMHVNQTFTGIAIGQ